MNRQQHRLDQREQGRRRVTVATRTTVLAGTALTAAFGFVLAQHGTATANPHSAGAPAVVAPATSAPTSAPTSANTPPTTGPSASTQAIAPAPTTTLQTPTQAPATTTGGRNHSGSGAT